MSAAAQVIKAMAKGAKEGAKKGAASASKTRGGGKADGALDRIDKHIESLLTTPTKGQQKVETAVKSQRVYRQGQNKAGAAGTAAGAGAMYFMMDVGGEKVSVPADKAKNPNKLKTSDVEILEEKEVSDFEKAFSEAFENGEETFMWNGKEYAVELKTGDRTMKSKGGKIISLVEKLFDIKVPTKTASKKKQVVDESRAEELLQEEMEKNPQLLDELSDEDYMELMDSLSPSTRAKFGVGEEPADDMFEMMQDMSPAETAKNLQFFDSVDDIQSYTMNLNPQQTREFLDNVPEEDYDLFGGFENMMKELGPREVKAEGGKISKKDIEYINSIKNKKDREAMIGKYQIFAGYDAIKEAGIDELKEPEKAEKIKKEAAAKALSELKRYGLNKGGMLTTSKGSMLVPPEMESDVPEDTYSNIPEDEMDDVMAAQKPDDAVEEDYVSYVMSEVLSEEEVDYVNSMLEADDKFSQIFDKLILSAAEFQGSGEVEGPGDGTSDDIPARLSDGEFVFTKKATDQLGAETLQSMMDDAERAYDGGLMKKAEGGLLFNPMSAVDDPVAAGDSAQTQLDVERQMLRANRVPSLIGG
jgi:hypothetical protein